jgi:hydroxypyruvate isomerase
MLRFAVNISTVFTDSKLLDRFAAAAQAGFPAVEIQTPYECTADELAQARTRAGLDNFVLMSFPAGDRAKGDRAGIASLPDRVDEVAAGIETGRLYAERLGTKRINMLCGAPGPEVEKARAHATLVENFRRAARAVRDIGASVLLEPINNHDVPGYFVPDVDGAIAVLDEIGEPNVGLQFDFYHVHRMGRPLIPTFERLLPRIAHMQFSDSPGRREPGTGTIDYKSVFDTVARSAYAGWTAAEYFPDRPSRETLAWFQPYRRS